LSGRRLAGKYPASSKVPSAYHFRISTVGFKYRKAVKERARAKSSPSGWVED